MLGMRGFLVNATPPEFEAQYSHATILGLKRLGP